MKRTYSLTTILVVLIASRAIRGWGSRQTNLGRKEPSPRRSQILDHIWLDAAHNRDTGTMAWLFADNL